MSAGAAALILAHENPQHVRRLIGTLRGLDIALHCDSRAPDVTVSAMIGDAPGVHLVPRHRTSRFSWSLVEAELDGLRTLLANSTAEHIVVMSGSCYPLVSATQLQDELRSWRGRSRMLCFRIPHRQWNPSRGRADGGQWRFHRRFLSFRHRHVLAHGRPVPVPGLRHPVPASLCLHGSAQWKIYARAHAKRLLEVLDSRPDLVRFWRSTFGPEESCVASILSSPRLTGDCFEHLVNDVPWYIDWLGSDGNGHPRWLNIDDLSHLVSARTELPPGVRFESARHDLRPKLFARKIDPGARELLDRIDTLLRV